MSRVFIKIPLGSLSEPTIKVAISVPELARQTNEFSIRRRPNCTATLLDSSPKDLLLHYNVKCRESYSDPNGHDVIVHFDVSKITETGNANDLDVRVSCSCPAFLYWGAQWNLHQRDGLEGQPRPLLAPPQEKLELRGHFVICKHVKAVFERILPSVQHNINNLLRDIEVQKNKERGYPPRNPDLEKEQEKVRKRKQLEKIRKIKNKKVRQEMLDALVRQEEERLKHEDEIEHEEEGTDHVVERKGPATGPKKETPAWMQLPSVYAPSKEEQEVLDALQKEEEKRLHEQGKPHLHHGLPYEPESEEEEGEE